MKGTDHKGLQETFEISYQNYIQNPPSPKGCALYHTFASTGQILFFGRSAADTQFLSFGSRACSPVNLRT